jgi:hypothetical protein
VLVAAAAVAIALPAVIYAARAGTPAVTADVCIKPNGQLRVVTPNHPCRSPETAEQWTVGGVKELRAGEGLVARNDAGVVALNVDPGLIESATAAKIFAGFDDEGDIPGAPGAPLVEIGTLDLPTGAFAVWAKLTVTTDEEASWSVRCRLEAGADFDESRVELSVDSSLFRGRAIPMALEVVHRFTEPGERWCAAAPSSERTSSS